MAHFDALCDADTVTRQARLAGLRARDRELAVRLERLLAADRRTDDGLDEPGGAVRMAVGLEDVVLDGRWRLLQRLGGGGGGEVWRAADLKDGPDVAVKLLHPALVDSPRQVRRFRREFYALSRLDHEGCVSVIAEGAVGPDAPVLYAGRRYMVMEHVGGGDLRRLARAPDGVLLPALIQLALALEYIHRRQIVHRDLKPSNVLLTPEQPPRVKLADFGIAKLADGAAGALTDSDVLMGTVDYLSPEQVRGEPVDPRSDLYALGCLLHGLWAGEVPFGGTRMQRVWARVNQAAPPLASRAPSAPPDLCALADDLLQRERDHRPKSAYEVVRRLHAILGTLPHTDEQGGVTPAEPPGQGAFLYPPGIVGRDDTMGLLLEAAASARSGEEARVVALVGAAGLGKTTLADALCVRLSDEGWRTVRVAAAEERGGPFAPFPALLSRLDATDPVARRDLPNAELLAFRARPEQAVHRARRRLAKALATGLTRGPSPRPVAVVLEDLHEASPGALGVLADLADALAGLRRPVLLLATGRPQARAPLAAVPRARLVDLEPLDERASSVVLARILGAGRSELSETLTRPLLEEAAGNPLLLRTAMRNLAESGGLRRDGDAWSVDPAVSPRRAVASLLEARIASLDDVVVDALAVAARIGERFDADLLAAVMGVDEEALVHALSQGVEATVLRPVTGRAGDPDVYGFEHARLAELLGERLAPPRAAAVHDAIGEALQVRAGSTALLAHHFGRGRDPRRALEHLGAAVEEARRARDQAMVVRHLDRMLARLDELPAEEVATLGPDLREQRADALVSIGRYEEASTALRALEQEATDRVDCGRLLRKRGGALLRTEAPGEGVTALQGALVLLGDRTPRTRVGRIVRLSWDAVAAVVGRLLPSRRYGGVREERVLAHSELALTYRWIDLYDSAAHLARFYRLADRGAPAEHRVDANAMATMLFALRSMPGAAGFVQERARALARASGDRVGLARLTIIQAGCELMLEDSSAALARMEEGVALARETGDRWLFCFALSQQAWARGMVGSVPRARRDFAEAEALAESLGAGVLRADARCGRMLSALAVGRVAEGEEAARAMLASDIRLAFPVFEELAVEGMAGVAFLRGRFGDALVGYERAYELLVRHRLDEGWGWLAPMEVMEAACCLVDQSGAAAVPRLVRRLKRAQRAVKRMSRLPMYRGCGKVARGVVASRQGRADVARRLFEEGRADRGPARTSYMDTWMRVRPALEGLHLGDDRDLIAEELDAVDREYARRELEGMRGWLAIMRDLHGV